MPQSDVSDDNSSDWISRGQIAIQNHDPSLGRALLRITQVPDALISSEEFHVKFIEFQQLHGEHCDAEEDRMQKSLMPRDRFERHVEEHLSILDKIHHVYFHAMKKEAQTARQTYELLVAEIYKHIIEFDMNDNY